MAESRQNPYSVSEGDRDLGFVLRATPYQERDLILTLFTENKGRMTGIARNGVQSRRFGGSLDLFLASEFYFEPKAVRLSSDSAQDAHEWMIPLKSAHAKTSFRGINQSLEKMSVGGALNELLLKILPTARATPDLFKLYSNALLALEQQPETQTIGTLNACLLKFAQWLGVQPSLTRCQSCQKPLPEVTGEVVFPLVTQGAWQCRECAKTHEATLHRSAVEDALLSMTRPIRQAEFQSTPEHQLQLLVYLERHLAYFVPGLEKQEISSIRVLKSLRSLQETSSNLLAPPKNFF